MDTNKDDKSTRETVALKERAESEEAGTQEGAEKTVDANAQEPAEAAAEPASVPEQQAGSQQETEPAEAPVEAPVEGNEDGAGAEAEAETGAEAETDAEAGAEAEAGQPPLAAGSGVLPGAGAVVAAGLGVASLGGTWLGTMLSDRAQLVGQIYAQANSGKMTSAEQISKLYGTPWHTVAAVNGIFALVALVLAGLVLVLTGKRAATFQHPGWVRAVSWGAGVLGVVGLLIAIAMYTDLFAALPAVAGTSAG